MDEEFEFESDDFEVTLHEQDLYSLLTRAFLWGELAGLTADSSDPPVSCDDLLDEVYQEIHAEEE